MSVRVGNRFEVLGDHISSEQIFSFLKLTEKKVENVVKYVESHWRRSDIFMVNFEHISHLFLVFLLLMLNR